MSEQSADAVDRRVKKGLEALAADDLGGAHYEFSNATIHIPNEGDET